MRVSCWPLGHSQGNRVVNNKAFPIIVDKCLSMKKVSIDESDWWIHRMGNKATSGNTRLFSDKDYHWDECFELLCEVIRPPQTLSKPETRPTFASCSRRVRRVLKICTQLKVLLLYTAVLLLVLAFFNIDASLTQKCWNSLTQLINPVWLVTWVTVIFMVKKKKEQVLEKKVLGLYIIFSKTLVK